MLNKPQKSKSLDGISIHSSRKSENTYYNDQNSSVSQTSEETIDLENGLEKWRRIRSGTLAKFDHFETTIEESKESVSMPPYDPEEPIDETKNWPSNCPVLHLDFNDFRLLAQQRFGLQTYRFWKFIFLNYVWDLMSRIVTQLIVPSTSLSTMPMVQAFVIAFGSYFWFFFCYFRVLYNAMRYRDRVMYQIFIWHNVLHIGACVFFIFQKMNVITKMLKPLNVALGSAFRQNPKVAAVFVAGSLLYFFSILLLSFFFIRKAHFFCYLELEAEYEIYYKEQSLKTAVRDKTDDFFRRVHQFLSMKPDSALPAVDCSIQMFGFGGKEIWIEGSLIFDTLFLEFKAYQKVFDYLLKVRYSYHDVIDFRKLQKTMLLIVIENSRAKQRIELKVNLKEKKKRTEYLKSARRLISRIRRNTNLIIEDHDSLQKAGLVGEYQDPVEEFKKERRLENDARTRDNVLTDQDWEKLLGGISMRICQPGDILLRPNDPIEKLYYIASGGLRLLDVSTSEAELEAQKEQSIAFLQKEDDVLDWVQESLARNREIKHDSVWPEDSKMEELESKSDSGSSQSEYSDDLAYEQDEDTCGTHQKLMDEGSVLGVRKANEIVGVVPFLLQSDSPELFPKSRFVFEVTDQNTLLYTLDVKWLKEEVLKPKKEITAAWFKYLAVILGERVERAEHAIHAAYLAAHAQKVAYMQDKLLEQKRKLQEESGFEGLAEPPLSIQELFGFDVTEKLVEEYVGDYHTYITEKDKGAEKLKLKGVFYLTDHYIAFVGVPRKLAIEKKRHKVVIPYEQIVDIREKDKKGISIKDQSLEWKLLLLHSHKDRRKFMEELSKKWRRDSMEGPARERALLCRRIASLASEDMDFVQNILKPAATAILAELTERDKRELFTGTAAEAKTRNQLVIQENTNTDALYLLQSGRIRIQQLREHNKSSSISGRAIEKIALHEVKPGEIFGFDTFLTRSPASSSYLVDSEKAVIRCCIRRKVMEKLKEEKRLASKFYRVSAVSLALRLAEISPLDALF